MPDIPVIDSLFDLADLAAEPTNPKDLRVLLLAGLVATIEEDILREESDIDPERVSRIDLDPSRAHAYAWHEVRGMRAVLAHVRRALETREEWLLAAEERGQRPPAAERLECARHRDACAHCEGMSQAAAVTRRERDHLEQVRCIYVQGLHDITSALGDPQRTLTLPQVKTALGKIQGYADREWRRTVSRG